MISRWTIILAFAVLFLMGGCAYRYYLGFHGPSTKRYPEIHQGVTQDSQCLGCHQPDKNSLGPATSHPEFTGCLKCHSD